MEKENKIAELLNKAMQSGAMLFGHCVGNFGRKYYAKNHWRLVVDNLGYTDDQYSIYDYTDRDICGKDGGFIKWLVENDKIDLDTQAMQYAKSDLSKFFTEWEDENGMSDDYAMLLMLLAIQDKPIDFLISILK